MSSVAFDNVTKRFDSVEAVRELTKPATNHVSLPAKPGSTLNYAFTIDGDTVRFADNASGQSPGSRWTSQTKFQSSSPGGPTTPTARRSQSLKSHMCSSTRPASSRAQPRPRLKLAVCSCCGVMPADLISAAGGLSCSLHLGQYHDSVCDSFSCEEKRSKHS